mgnify:CR=1 FL=1
MNKSLAKLLSSAVVLGSVFFSLQTTASPQDGNELNVQFLQQMVKQIQLVAIRMVVLSGLNLCLIKVRDTK